MPPVAGGFPPASGAFPQRTGRRGHRGACPSAPGNPHGPPREVEGPLKLYGNGRAALMDDPATASRLGWGERRRSLPDPEVLLRPREGDPREEPWVVPGWADSA